MDGDPRKDTEKGGELARLRTDTPLTRKREWRNERGYGSVKVELNSRLPCNQALLELFAFITLCRDFSFDF